MMMRLVRRTERPVGKPLTAIDVMTPNPKSIDQLASVRETAEVLQKNGIHIAPIIDVAGRPIGVVSRTDLLDYWGRRRDRLAAMAGVDPAVGAVAEGGQFGLARQGIRDAAAHEGVIGIDGGNVRPLGQVGDLALLLGIQIDHPDGSWRGVDDIFADGAGHVGLLAYDSP